jgi:hypothetical protein
MIAIYAQVDTPRLRFALNLVFSDVLGVEHRLFTNAALFQEQKVYRINYSILPLAAELTIEPHSILFETDLRNIDTPVGNWNGLPVIFPNSEANFPFDLPAASFYLATRYEEYLPYTADKHGRFRAEDSLAYRAGFLQKPLINLWCAELKRLFLNHFEGLHFENRAFSYLPTFDIDNAWAYRNKGLPRTIGGLAKSLFKQDFRQRLKVLAGDTDPYDTYDYQLEIIQKNQLSACYFFLLADYGPFDTNISHHQTALKELINRIADVAQVGIHPSYGSHASPSTLQNEINRLQVITHKTVNHSRQHFLKFTLPETYQQLANLGIQNDYSMGYASQPGFRASICSTFSFFNLSANTQTALRIHPLTYMDGTLCEYMQLQPDEAISLISKLLSEVNSVNGRFISLWHNDTLNDKGKWKGWRRVFEENIRLCNSPENR